MCYDINSIRKTTEKGIPDLADKIFAGIVNEEEAINALFKGLRSKLAKELEKRRADEVLWGAASESKELKKLKDYVETYDNEAPEYIGRHIDEANSLISLIENDDAEWYDARSKDTISAYRHYLDIYDNPAPSYRGKYIDQVNEAIKIIKDRDDWAKAKGSNSIRSYSNYLLVYDKNVPEYVGQFVNEARQAIFSLEDNAAWQLATNLNTVESYQAYLSKYDIASSAYRGKYVESAKQKIEELLPPPPPDPRIADDEAWREATSINTLDGYRHYLSLYTIHANEAELAIRHLIDEKAWKDAKDGGNIASYEKYLSICKVNEYPGYEWAHVNAAKTQIGNLQKAEESKRKEEERKRRIADDNAAWNKARLANTKHSYAEYHAKYRKTGGLHIREAENAILKLQSEEDWERARAENTLAAYKRFVDKYEPMSNKYMSMHLPEAKKKVRELTPKPTPIKWKKWLFIVLALALSWFLWIQWQDNAWPFNIFQDDSTDTNETQDVTAVVENVHSLQWAIDNHNIPMLEKYANQDSVRAYYPLALALNEQDSVANLEKTLHWLDLVLDPDVNSLHQNIINDIQKKELDDLEARFSAINPNEKDAERNYLIIYKEYVSHFERLATHIPKIIVHALPIEDMATAQINERQKHEELRTSILREWEAQRTKLQNVLSLISDNAKKAYTNNNNNNK